MPLKAQKALEDNLHHDASIIDFMNEDTANEEDCGYDKDDDDLYNDEE